MKKVNNLVFLPNTGDENFMPADKQTISSKLSVQASADFPKISSLDYVPTKGSSEGMIPIRNKPKR